MANKTTGGAAGSTGGADGKGGTATAGAGAEGTTTGTSTTDAAAGKTTETADGKAGAGKDGDGKTTDTAGKETAEPGKDGGDTSTSKAPDKYDLKLPENARLTADDVKLAEAIARENGWSNDDAQGFLDDQAFTANYAATMFLEASKADKEIGGDKMPETLRLSTLALDKLHPKGTKHGDAFRSLMDRSAFGNHPEVLRHFANLGRMMQEDKPGSPGATGGAKKVGAAQKLYGDSDKA